MNNKYNFEKDVTDSLNHAQQLGLGEEGMVFLGHDEILDIAWQKFKRKSWWIILIPFHVRGLAEAIEFGFYPPKTRKNAGFEIVPLPDYLTSLVFAHKSCMSAKQLTVTLNKFTDGTASMEVKEDKDLISFLCFKEPETHEWIRKIEAAKRKAYEPQPGKKHGEFNTVEFDVKTNNPNVIREIQQYEPLSRLYDELLDYFLKQQYGV